MILRLILTSCLLMVAPELYPQAALLPIVKSVQVEGNLRVPAVTVLHTVSIASGQKFDEVRARADLRRLYDLGLFRNIDIHTRAVGKDGVDVIYTVKEQPFVSDFVIEGVGKGQEEQIRSLLEKEHVAIQPSTPFNPGTAGKAASLVRSYLYEKKYPLSEVRVVADPEPGNNARVRLTVAIGPHLDVGSVQFSGNDSIPSKDLLRQLQRIRPASFWMPWEPRGAYSPENLVADLDNISRYYKSQGYARVRVGKPEVVATDFERPSWQLLHKPGGSETRLSIVVPILEGPRYQLESATPEGDARFAGDDVNRILEALNTPSGYDESLLTSTRQKIVDALGHHGYGLAQVQLEQVLDDSLHTVKALYRIFAGDPVLVGRIEFAGNNRLKEKFLRRELAVREGEVFDSFKLDESVRRLNRSGMIKELQRADVALDRNDETGDMDVTFNIKEKDQHGIFGTGGTGGIGGGYLGVIYTAFDLLGLGESLTMQLDGGASQSNMLLNIVGTRFLGFPFTLGLSVFHRVTNFNVASLVPDQNDLVQILRHRSTGTVLSGSYPITSRIQVGLSTQFERLTVSEDLAGGDSGTGNSVENRTELAPSFAFDTTSGSGPGTRGSRFLFSSSWAGPSFLRSIDSTAQAIRYSQYLGDPLSHGRNSFAFRFQAAMIRPHHGVPLTSDRRFYPGDEIVRGFQRGGMSPWRYPGTGETSPVPFGADTVLGFSMEYRIPIHGALSGAAFADFGWSGLSNRSLSLNTGSRLISGTNHLLRASVGGELRLQLPVIHQPARLIFSWNPLRLDRLIYAAGSPLRLVDPRGTIRFALGDLF